MTAVLVVDDDEGIRDLLSSELQEAGYDVFTAEHGGPALERLRASPEPLVVLLGLMMPVVDGRQVLETIAADPALASRHRVILVTAAAKAATEGRLVALCEQLNVPLIPKPFGLDEMLEAVARAAGQLA